MISVIRAPYSSSVNGSAGSEDAGSELSGSGSEEEASEEDASAGAPPPQAASERVSIRARAQAPRIFKVRFIGISRSFRKK